MAVYFGKYRALVLKLDDPEKRGRIKVQCPEMYGDYESPWCEPCFANAVDGAGDFNLPPVGEGVWIEFEKGDPQYPIYTGGWWTASKTPIIDYTLAPETRKIGKGGSSINFEKDGANENVNVVTDNFLVNGAPISLVIPVEVSDEAYDATAWNGVVSLAPSKNALRDKFEALASSYGISKNSPVKVSAADVATGEYARFTTTGLESRTITEVLTDLKTVDGTGSGLDADLLDGVHANTFLPRIENVNGVLVRNNWGAMYSSTATNTGYIVLDFGKENMMFDAEISIRAYSFAGQVQISGYTYVGNTNWHHQRASGSFNSPLNVRFTTGGANGKRYVLIGEPTTEWGSHLQVTVTRLSWAFGENNQSSLPISLTPTYQGVTTSSTVYIGTQWHSGNLEKSEFAPASHTHDYVPTARTVTAGNGLTGGGALSANITLTMGTPGTCTASSTSAVTASSHTHAITTTSEGAVSTIVQTNASGDIACRLVRPTYANQATISGAIAFRINNSTDNYIRFCSDAAAIRTFIGAAASSHTHSKLTAGNGLSGTAYNGGTAYTWDLGTPSSCTASTTNGVTSASHTHAITGFLPTTKVATGHVTGLNTSAWSSVSFGKTFSSVPRVVATYNRDITGDVNELKIRSVTTTGFEITIGGSGFSSWEADWIAILV